MLLDSNAVFPGLFLLDKAFVFLLTLILSIVGAACKIISCASSHRVSTSIIWTCILVILVGAFVFISTSLKVWPQPSFQWLQ